ncbi:unnamed protein product [Mycena citricolor]|uniref:DRBM domain-containing protein n=1 Tax=Mycena citricolor TaxID=2018698 RepID=A0AAD2Q681_9AGAR|nr:unnamed protein product [Mycena citricolor]
MPTNYVTRLNNYYQALDQAYLISYAESSTGPSSNRIWTMECKVSGEVKGVPSLQFSVRLTLLRRGVGQATTKAAAKEAAAMQACTNIGIE